MSAQFQNSAQMQQRRTLCVQNAGGEQVAGRSRHLAGWQQPGQPGQPGTRQARRAPAQWRQACGMHAEVGAPSGKGALGPQYSIDFSRYASGVPGGVHELPVAQCLPSGRSGTGGGAQRAAQAAAQAQLAGPRSAAAGDSRQAAEPLQAAPQQLLLPHRSPL